MQWRSHGGAALPSLPRSVLGAPAGQGDPIESVPNDTTRGRSRSWDLAFLVLVLLHLVPIWTVRYPPSCDGPAHLESAHALLQRTSADHPLYRKFLVLRRDPSVNWFPTLALAGLMLVAKPVIALKLFLTGYLLLLPYALRYALVAIHRRAGWLALLSLPLLFNTLFLRGFLSFHYGLAILLFTLGYWLRVQDVGLAETWRLTGCALALQFTHMFALAGACVILAALGVAQAWACRRRGRRAVLRLLACRLLAPLFAFLPALTLAAVYLLPRLEVGPALDVATADRLLALPLTGYGDRREAWLAAGLVASLAVVAALVAAQALRRRRFLPADGLILALGFWLGLWLVAPERLAGGSFLAERAALCFFLTLVLWCASRPLAPALRTSGSAVVLALTLGLLAAHVAKAHEVSRQVERFLRAASRVPSGSALLSLGAPASGTPSRLPFLEHAASYAAVARRGLNLTNYQFAADHFPFAFRERLQPGRWLGLPLDARAHDVVGLFEDRGGLVDAVLLWTPTEEAPPCLHAILERSPFVAHHAAAPGEPDVFVRAVPRLPAVPLADLRLGPTARDR